MMMLRVCFQFSYLNGYGAYNCEWCPALVHRRWFSCVIGFRFLYTLLPPREVYFVANSVSCIFFSKSFLHTLTWLFQVDWQHAALSPIVTRTDIRKSLRQRLLVSLHFLTTCYWLLTSLNLQSSPRDRWIRAFGVLSFHAVFDTCRAILPGNAWSHDHVYISVKIFVPKVYLAQGLGVGLGSGITYIPSISILSHYFRRRRALALGIVASVSYTSNKLIHHIAYRIYNQGAATGGAIHPIMLNKLFHSSVGYHNGVRASAGLIAGILIISNLLMKTRPPPTPKEERNTLEDFRVFVRDPPYVITALG